MKNNTIWALILVIAVLETIAMGIIEDSANKNNNYYFLGILIYTLVAYTLYQILKTANVAITNALWNATTVILVSLMGIFYFEENFTFYQYIGLGVAILAIIFIEMPTLKKMFKS